MTLWDLSAFRPDPSQMVYTTLRATSHMSQEMWPCNCECSKESVRTSSQDTSKTMSCGHGPSSGWWNDQPLNQTPFQWTSIHASPHTWSKVVTPSTAKYLIPTRIFSPCVNTAMSQNRQTCMQVLKGVICRFKVSSLVVCGWAYCHL